MAGHQDQLDVSAVDAALQSWRQGDVLLNPDLPFVLLADARLPLTPASCEAAADRQDEPDGIADILTQERGIAIVSQTCDIVRAASERPFIEIVPIVELDEDDYQEAGRGRSLRYAVIPALVAQRLVADLDRVMTIEKPLLIRSAGEDGRTAGCKTDGDRRAFAHSLARRRGRFAFPNDLAIGMRKVVGHVIAKHAKDSDLGRFLLRLADIRVECPDWNAGEPRVTILFVFPSVADMPPDSATQAAALVGRFTPTGVFTSLLSQVKSLDTMTAARYLGTDALDLEYLSSPPGPKVLIDG